MCVVFVLLNRCRRRLVDCGVRGRGKVASRGVALVVRCPVLGDRLPLVCVVALILCRVSFGWDWRGLIIIVLFLFRCTCR